MSTAERTLPTPFYAVVGAGDVAVQEVKEAIERIRTRAESAQARVQETRTRLSDLPTEVNVEELRAKLNKDELKKAATPYIESATGVYKSLAERGEGAVERLRTQPLVQENLDRVGTAYNQAVDLTEDALGAVSSQTRAVGERAASLAGLAAEKVEDAALAVEEAGDKVKAESKVAAQKIDGAAGTVEAKGRTAKASPAKKIEAAKAPAKKAPARKTAPKPAAK
ncbi:MAG: heparin-binding hemagglutinin [Gordonia sp. (in: high G+C Gram-positive bacteria)]